MSSTDDAKLRRFHRDELCSAARALAQRGVQLFPLGFDERPSWYEKADPAEPEFIAFEADALERTLREHWEKQGLPELVRLAPKLAELARELELSEEQSADVSPFVYVMY
jgi:5'-deoxynucleotidase YfbR-like HD superfamily hydrolase